MKTLPWRRSDLIAEINDKVWMYLSPAADVETELLQAAALLRMPSSELLAIAQLQFLASAELGVLLDQLPRLMRRLATTTTSEEEWSAERVRGAIQWSKTLSMRNATGLPHLYITEPSRRAFQTPENEMLVHLLDETVRLGKLTGWYQSTSEAIGRLFTERVNVAERWRHTRSLAGVERRPLTPAKIARIRSGRHRRRYDAALSAWAVYQELVARLDRKAIRRVVESNGLVTQNEPRLFELQVTMRVIDAIRAAGWDAPPLGLWEGALRLQATRGRDVLTLYYQSVPAALSRDSHYRAVQRSHQIQAGGLIPDLIVHRPEHTGAEWLLIEVKGGARRVEHSARAALIDLLAYRRAFEPALVGCSRYGLGVAFGAELKADTDGEIGLVTPDSLEAALDPTLL